MTPECSQLLDNGRPCAAPAVHDSTYCRHHDPLRPRKQSLEEPRESEPLSLQTLLDKPSMLAALNQVTGTFTILLAAILSPWSISMRQPSDARTLLSAIRCASRLVAEIAQEQRPLLPVAPAGDRNAIRSDHRLAASSDLRKPGPFSTARSASSYQSDIDADTARMVKELVAQSHHLAGTQAQRASSR